MLFIWLDFYRLGVILKMYPRFSCSLLASRVLQSVIINDGLECSTVRNSSSACRIKIMSMYPISNKSAQFLGRACNNWCRIKS